MNSRLKWKELNLIKNKWMKLSWWESCETICLTMACWMLLIQDYSVWCHLWMNFLTKKTLILCWIFPLPSFVMKEKFWKELKSGGWRLVWSINYISKELNLTMKLYGWDYSKRLKLHISFFTTERYRVLYRSIFAPFIYFNLHYFH